MAFARSFHAVALALVATGAALVHAASLPAVPAAVEVDVLAAAAGVSTLSASAVAALTPFTQFARAAYCPSSGVTGWACGGTSPFLVCISLVNALTVCLL